VSVSILDQKGRLVREFNPGWESSMMVAWDGKTQSGLRVPAGIYAVKVRNGGNSAAGSFALVPR
jgi:flagellar hook assembly protein FlgD